jgi:hypothetical protein
VAGQGERRLNVDEVKAWDEYEIKARYIPCFISAIFPVHFLVLFLGVSFWETLTANIGWLMVANISLSLVVTLALIQLQSGIAKHWVEEGVFGEGGINFPTTNFLLFKDAYLSKGMKVAIRKKIKEDFNFELMDEDQEGLDIDEARKTAREAVGLIRRSVGKGIMTHHYNIRYGFIRNLIGGALWGLAGSVGAAAWYGFEKNWQALTFFSICALIFLVLILSRKIILKKFACQYTEILFNEYMFQKGGDK